MCRTTQATCCCHEGDIFWLMYSHDMNDGTFLQLERLMAVTHSSITIAAALRNILFQIHSAEPQASFLLIIPSSHPHLNKKCSWNERSSHPAFVCVFLLSGRGKSMGRKKKRKALTIQTLSQLWNEHWNIQWGFMSLTVQCSADCCMPDSWSQFKPPPSNHQSPALSVTLPNCYSLRPMPLIQIIKPSPISLLRFNLNT